MELIKNSLVKGLSKPKFDKEVTLSVAEILTLWKVHGRTSDRTNIEFAESEGHEKPASNSSAVFKSLDMLSEDDLELSYCWDADDLDQEVGEKTGDVTLLMTPDELYTSYIAVASPKAKSAFSGTKMESVVNDLAKKLKALIA